MKDTRLDFQITLTARFPTIRRSDVEKGQRDLSVSRNRNALLLGGSPFL